MSLVATNRVKRFWAKHRGQIIAAVNQELIARAYCHQWIRRVVSPFFAKREPIKWIFIVGCYNSGTTLLRSILGADPRIATLPREGVRFTSAFPDLQEGGWIRMMYHNRDIAEMPIPSEMADLARTDWSPWWKRSADYFLEKSITHATRIGWINRNFDSPKFLGIIRSPYPVCEGVLRRAKPKKYARALLGGQFPIEMVAQQWVYVNRMIGAANAEMENLYLMRYEDLAEKPDVVLEEVYSFLGLNCAVLKTSNATGSIKFSIGQGQFSVRNMNAESIARLGSEDIQRINSAIGNVIADFGYPLVTEHK